ncbi:MAG: hypothetical protein ABS75_10850 [Pelagibacterium sp. SCN 63-23]|nr:MAG: hypothetical protein ABS75_10850 [Pelagibacterium sp. SCN 63-23]
MLGLLRRAAGGEFGDEQLAQLRAPAAAVLHEKARDFADAFNDCPVDDGSAVALRLDQAGTGQNREMRRHRILRHLEMARYLAGWQPFRFMLHKETECVEACRLRQGGENFDSAK